MKTTFIQHHCSLFKYEMNASQIHRDHFQISPLSPVGRSSEFAEKLGHVTASQSITTMLYYYYLLLLLLLLVVLLLLVLSVLFAPSVLFKLSVSALYALYVLLK